MSTVHLLGGGWDPETVPATYGPFLRSAGDGAVVATVVLDEGDGAEQLARWDDVLPLHARARARAGGSVLDVGALPEADALLVCGGLTPAYAAALAPVASQLRG